MADKLNRLAPTGNLDTDSDPRYVGRGEGKTGDTTQNRNTQIAGDEGSTSGDITPTLGNRFGFDLGSVQAQDKIYRVTVDGDAAKNHSLSFLSTKRDGVIGTGTGPNGEVEFNGTVASLVAAVQAAGLSAVMSILQSGNEVTFRMTAYPYYQWYLESVGTDDVSVICTQEAIPVDLAGPLKDIGSYDLLGDLFVFSTTQDNEPTELNLVVTAIGPITAGVYTGPLTFLTFSQPHGLVAGQWIRITNSQAPWLNGLFVVRQINSPTQIGIPTVLAWGGTRPLVTSFTEVIRINPSGIGEIGVAQKDDNSDSWSYIRLLRSVELNFVSKWKIDCHVHRDNVSTNLYYTDDYNIPRILRHLGAYFLDSALSYVNSLNEYLYGAISPQSSLISLSSALRFSFIKQNQSGGVLRSGNKYYYSRIITAGGSATGWSASSQGVSVYDVSQTALPRYIAGDKPAIVTSKSNVLSVQGNGLSYFLGSEMEFAVLQYTEGVLSATVFDKRTITSSNEIIFTHTGKEEYAYNLDVGELAVETESFIPIKAKNIRSIDSRNVLSNIETLNKINLSEWVKTFRHSLKKKYITESTKFQTGEYQFPESNFDDVGFMLNETYRIGCRAFIRGVGKTDVFHVDDIRIDTLPNNIGNPSDNRRNSNSITNYDLTEEINPNRNLTALYNGNTSLPANSGSPNDQGYQNQSGVLWDAWEDHNNKEFFIDANGNGIGSSVSRLIVPRINIEDIDYNFEIEGFGSAYDIIEGLEFFISDIPKSVKASGIGVMSVKEVVDETLVIWKDTSQLDTGLILQSDQIVSLPSNEPYVYEYPFATGSQNGNNMPVNFPLSSELNGVDLDTKFNGVRDIISFYSGDTYLDKDESYSSEQVNVFGACELMKNWKTRYNRATIAGLSGDLPASAYDGAGNLQWDTLNKTEGFMSVFHPTKTSNTYEEITIRDYVYIDPSQDPDLSGTAEIGSLSLQQDVPDVIANLTVIGDETFVKALPCLTTFEGSISGTTFNLPFKNKMLIGNQMNVARGPVVYLDNDIDLNSTQLSPSFVNNKEVLRYSNRGVVYCQLYTNESDNYPSIYDTKYFSVGSMLLTPQGNIDNVSHDLTCGDTRTQTTIIKHRGAGIDTLFKAQVNLLAEAGDSEQHNKEEAEMLRLLLGTGFGSGLIFVGQNRVNSNMYAVPDTYKTNTIVTENSLEYYPMLDDFDWNERFQWESPPVYDTSYNKLPEIFLPTYQNNPRLGGSVYDFPARIIYSQRKDESGIFDEYRFFLPLDKKDLDRTFGDISHHEDINGELFTVQFTKYQRQIFNGRGQLEASTSSVEVFIGDGTVMSRDGVTLSSYGTQHKWSCIKGLNDNGKDVLYWFNAENGLMMRFGEDGTRVISSRGMTAFFANYTKWVKDKHEPAFEQGIRGVWDDRRKEAIWTFIGWRNVSEWNINMVIPFGQLSANLVVRNDNAPSDTYEGFPRLFRIKQFHVPSAQSEPGVGVDWEDFWTAIPYTDKAYYTIFTICFNEMTNGFRCFYGHLPKTYLRWQNTFLSSHPVHRNLIFEHRLGEPTTWYGVNTFLTGNIAPKVEDAYFEMVINDIPEQSFGGVAVDALTENAPDRVEYRTARQYTFDNAVDFEQRDDQFYSPIKNDATLTNNPDSDGEYLRGDFLKVKVFIFGGTYNLFHSIVVKIRETLRRTNT